MKTFESWLKEYLHQGHKMSDASIEKTIDTMRKDYRWNICFAMDTDEYWDSIDPEELGPVERETALDIMDEQHLKNAVDEALVEYRR